MERKQFKADRAKAIAAAAQEAEQAFAEGREIPTVPSVAIPSSSTWRPPSLPIPVQGSETSLPQEELEQDPEQNEDEELENLEHLQLSLAEAFFLAWTLQCLYITDPQTVRNSTIYRLRPVFTA